MILCLTIHSSCYSVEANDYQTFSSNPTAFCFGLANSFMQELQVEVLTSFMRYSVATRIACFAVVVMPTNIANFCIDTFDMAYNCLASC